MWPKARGLAQHGGPPGWLEENDPTGMILYVMDGPYSLPFLYSIGFSLLRKMLLLYYSGVWSSYSTEKVCTIVCRKEGSIVPSLNTELLVSTR
jgi:hypothetical protein